MSDLDLLIGEWIVKVRPTGRSEPWTWGYEFRPGNKVTWRDLKGAERGSGTWAATSELVNIWWEGSEARESWKRPLEPSLPPNKTWYVSSYYTGQYKVEKPLCPGFSTGGPFKLDLPGNVSQGNALVCWAAGSASWLQGTKRGSATVEDLVKKYKAAGKVDNDGALPEENLIEVFRDIGIALKRMPAADFTYCFAREKLEKKGHLVLLYSSGGSLGHTRVLYGVGDPNNESFNVFDPWMGKGYITRRFDSLEGTIYVGWAK